jgi:hypothetical protein
VRIVGTVVRRCRRIVRPQLSGWHSLLSNFWVARALCVPNLQEVHSPRRDMPVKPITALL